MKKHVLLILSLLLSVIAVQAQISVTDVTNLIINRSFENGVLGWDNYGMQTQSNEEFLGKDGISYCERWVSAPSTLPDSHISQTISVENGIYRFSAHCSAVQLSYEPSTIEGVFLYANEVETEISIPNATRGMVRFTPKLYSCFVEVTNGKITLGYKTKSTNASWAAWDNTKLFRYNNATLNEAKIYHMKEQMDGVVKVAQGYIHNPMQASLRQQFMDNTNRIDKVDDYSNAVLLLEMLKEELEEIKKCTTAYANVIGLIDKAKADYDSKKNNADLLRQAMEEANTSIIEELLDHEEMMSLFNSFNNVYRDYLIKNFNVGDRIDFTDYIKNPDVRKTSEGWMINSNAVSITSNFDILEVWSGSDYSFNISQTIHNLPVGKYQLGVTGFFRAGANDSGLAYINGSEDIQEVLFANDQTAPIHSLYEHKTDEFQSKSNLNGYIDNMENAGLAFDAGLYGPFDANGKNDGHNLVEVNVTNGTLTIGLRNTSATGLSWYAFRDFTLSYVGKVDIENTTIIENAEQLIEFANYVNSTDGGVDHSDACAILTADIDLTGKTWVPIGTGDRRYKGTFDGQFHRVKNMVIKSTIKEQGFFGVVESATVKNLIIDKSCSVTLKDAGCAAAFAGCCNGSGTLTFENCGNEANIHGEKATNAAFVGCNYSGGALKIVITSCYNTGNVEGGWENAIFSGWFASAGEVINSYNLGKVSQLQENMTLGRGLDDSYFINTWDLNEESISKPENRRECYTLADFTDEWFATGQFCYLLNGDQSEIGWYQNIGEDAMPTFDPSHKQVYPIGEVHCNGDLKDDVSGFSNDPSVTKRDEHNFVDGICDYCGIVDETYVTCADGICQIGNAKQLKWFSAYAAQQPDAKAVLTGDIDLTGVKDYKPIGNENNIYIGTFDGQFHRIKNLEFQSDADDQGLFGVCGGATIKNLIIDSSCSFVGKDRIGAFVGSATGKGTLTIENCGNEADVAGVRNASAFLGANNNGDCKIVIRNCYNTGAVSGGYENGIFCGWFAYTGTITNCWNTGDLINGNDNNSLGRGIELSAFINTYDLNTNNRYGEKEAAALKLADYSSAWTTNGRFCYMLNGDQSEIIWYQNIGSDNTPTIDSSHKQVFIASDLYCDGTPKNPDAAYSNTHTNQSRDAHQYKDGICSHCGDFQKDYLNQEADGYYLVETPSQFRWFAAKACSDGSVKCKLTSDLDMTNMEWEPITRFGGVIDGQMHTISNLIINKPAKDKVGLISVGIDGATIRNIVMDATCSVTGASYVAAFIGSSDGTGTITFENVGNEADVTGTGADVAGIIGVSMGSTMFFQMDNVYNTGDITGDRESAALTGWAGNASEFNNCYNTGVVIGVDYYHTLYRGTATLHNCYSIDGHQAIGFTLEQLQNGALCYMLNGYQSGNTSWYQNLSGSSKVDSHPVFDPSHSIVCKNGDKYSNSKSSNPDGPIDVPYIAKSSLTSEKEDVAFDEMGYITLMDGGYSISSDFEGTVTGGVNYVRNFSSDKWQALYVPFDIPVTDELLADFEFAKINDTHQYDDDDDGEPDRTTIEFFKKKNGTLKANTPYLIRAKKTGLKILSIPETTLYPADECSIDCSTTDLMFTFYGVYRKRMADDIMGSYAMGGGSLVRAESSDVTLAPYRFYMTAEKRDGSGIIDLSIKLRIVGDDETTDIDYIPAETPTDAKYYDVWGRQYDAPVEGINIVNGRKYINK